jgi:universal stress protein A
MTVPTTILVPTDFSEYANAALDYATTLAGKLGAKVHLVHVLELPLFAAEMDFGLTRSTVDDLLSGSQKELDRLASTYATTCAFAPPHLEVGDARSQIERVAVETKADLVIMATHGRRGLKRVLLGSVADAIVRVAPCPVLLVRTAIFDIAATAA